MGANNNPKKVPKTVLMVGEGVAEKAWLNHLKKLFEQAEIETTVESGGGNALTTLRFVLSKLAAGESFDRVLVLMDTDESWGDPGKPDDLARMERIVKNWIKLLGTDPCFEGFLLRILNSPQVPKPIVVGSWKKNQHPCLLQKIHARFQDRIPAGATRPTGSLCDAHKCNIDSRLSGSLYDDGILAHFFPKQTLENAAQNHPVLDIILQYFRNTNIKYGPSIVVG